MSLPGVTPSANITWFQAQAGVHERGQAAAVERRVAGGGGGHAGPGPDDGTTDCNTASAFTAVATGSRTACVSARGAFDMVGNLYEWVADWVPRSTSVRQLESRRQCRPVTTSASPARPRRVNPRRLLRGGSFFSGAPAGPLAILGTNPPFA